MNTILQHLQPPLIGGPFDSNVSENTNPKKPFLVFRDSGSECVYVYKRKRTRSRYEWRYLGSFDSMMLAELAVFRNYTRDKVLLALCGLFAGLGVAYIVWALWW